MAVSAIGFGLFTAVFGIVSPQQEVHAFHSAVVASLLLVLSAPPALAVARSPERSTRPLVALAVLGIAGLASMALSLTLDPFTLPFVVVIGVLWALRPSREALPLAGPPSPILLLLALVAAVPLLGYALGQAELQRIDTLSSRAAFFHWIEMSFYAVAVLLLGILAALRPAAHRLAAWSGSAALAVLGAASLALGEYASVLDAPWAWAALVRRVVFVGVADWEARRSDPGSSGTRRVRVRDKRGTHAYGSPSPSLAACTCSPHLGPDPADLRSGCARVRVALAAGAAQAGTGPNRFATRVVMELASEEPEAARRSVNSFRVRQPRASPPGPTPACTIITPLPVPLAAPLHSPRQCRQMFRKPNDVSTRTRAVATPAFVRSDPGRRRGARARPRVRSGAPAAPVRGLGADGRAGSRAGAHHPPWVLSSRRGGTAAIGGGRAGRTAPRRCMRTRPPGRSADGHRIKAPLESSRGPANSAVSSQATGLLPSRRS
jgi:hypothetical protein